MADVSMSVVTLCDFAIGGVFTADSVTGGVFTAFTVTVVIEVDFKSPAPTAVNSKVSVVLFQHL